MSKITGAPQGDELAGMEEGLLVTNDVPVPQEDVPPQQEAEDADTSGEVETAETDTDPEADAGEDTSATEEKPKKNKTPRDERIKQLTAEKKDLQRQLDALKSGTLQAVAEDLKKVLTPPENSANVEEIRDTEAEPDPSKYRLGDLDPQFQRDIARWEVRQELRAERQRQAQQVAKAQQEQVASEILSKIEAIAEKGSSTYQDEDYVEDVIKPFLHGRLPLEEHTFEAAAETDYAHEIFRELAHNPAEALRVANLSPLKQIQYVAERARHFEDQKKPRLPKAPPPPQNMPRGTAARHGIRGDVESLDDIAKFLAN